MPKNQTQSQKSWRSNIPLKIAVGASAMGLLIGPYFLSRPLHSAMLHDGFLVESGHLQFGPVVVTLYDHGHPGKGND